MAAKQFMLQKELSSQEALELLKTKLHSVNISNLELNPNTNKIKVTANYYEYELMIVGTQLSITTKMVQKWLMIMIGCAIGGFILIFPALGAIAIAVLAAMAI